jgi:hypothetical protein
MPFHGKYIPDPTMTPRQKLDETIAEYREKFYESPRQCLTSTKDAELLKAESDLPVQVRGIWYVGRHTFYVGREG